jgi:hypothetical protein
MPFDEDAAGTLQTLLAESTGHNVPCGGGHLLQGKLTGTIDNARFDPDWMAAHS